MIKYLDMENATFEIVLETIDEYKPFLFKYSQDLKSLNLRRIIFNVKENSIQEIIDELDKYTFEDILIILKSNLTLNTKYKAKDNIIIVNINSSNLIVDENIFNQIDLKKNTLDSIIESINKGVNVIVNPIIDVNNIRDFNDNLNKLLASIKDKEININGYLISTDLMREHPCNAYLCNGWKCKKAIKGLPRHIYIDKNLQLYPHDLFFDKLFIGQLSNIPINETLNQYLNSKEHRNFTNYNKKAFIKYLAKYPYDLMPLIEYVRLEAENDK